MKVSELSGAKLDYWVAKAEKKYNPRIWKFEEGERCVTQKMSISDIYSPSSDWSQGGPIIGREGISLFRYHGTVRGEYFRLWCANNSHDFDHPDALVAAMRCYVSSKFGEEVPDEPTS